MPLNHINGERVEGMDLVYRVVPLEKYQKLPGLTVMVEETKHSPIKTKQVKSVPIWEAATNYAQQAFMNSGAPAGPLNYDVLCQEYYMTQTVCFIFCANIYGTELYVQAPFELSHEQIAELKNIGEWEDAKVN